MRRDEDDDNAEDTAEVSEGLMIAVIMRCDDYDYEWL